MPCFSMDPVSVSNLCRFLITGILTAAGIAGYIFGIAVYVAVTIPSLRTIVDPVPDVDTRNDQIEAMRVLAAGNTIIAVLLGAILALQVRASRAIQRMQFLTASSFCHHAGWAGIREESRGERASKIRGSGEETGC